MTAACQKRMFSINISIGNRRVSQSLEMSEQRRPSTHWRKSGRLECIDAWYYLVMKDGPLRVIAICQKLILSRRGPACSD